ncbi:MULTISPECIES: hypothetical protein [Acidithrix]|nr:MULTISPECIES: hypothetical protein [Acidithrix]CAG4904836.1 unnamed protein product [Acidithrix sp. C25]
MPLQHRHGYAAGFLRGLLVGDIDQLKSSRYKSIDARCYPAHIYQI